MQASMLVALLAVALPIGTYLFYPRGYTGADPFVLKIGPPPSDPAGDSCARLNRLEANAMKQASQPGGKQAMHDYEIALAAWRRQHPGYQPTCRTDALGVQMCHDGAHLEKLMGPATGDDWDGWMRELAAHESNTEDCRTFAARHVPEKWIPHVFHWPQETQEVILDEILGDHEYGSAYASAMHLAPPFGAPQLAFRQRPQGRFQMHRVELLNHWRVLRKSAPGVEVGNLAQIVEFGCGNGGAPAMFSDLGFSGVHYAYDFPPMLLMQRYWLHYSGIPAVLGADLPQSRVQVPTSGNMSIVLENALSDNLNTHLDAKRNRDSLFIATYSLTEADMASRAKIWSTIRDFGIIQMAFWGEFYGKNNMAHMKELVEDIKGTHDVVWWQMPHGWHATSGKAYYLVAVRKDRGTVHCSAEVGCSPETTQLFTAKA